MIFINSSPRDTLKIFHPFLPIFVPVGIGYLMAVLKKDGIRSICIDEQVDDNILDQIKQSVASFQQPYIFGFSVLTAAFKNALILSSELKKTFPECIIVFGGIHPTAMPDEVLSYKHIDIVVRGEAEDIISELVQCIKQRSDFSHLKSISYRQNNTIVHNPRSQGIIDLNALPSFSYEAFTNKKYDTGFVMSSRGCPYNCFFCSNKINSQRKFRYRSPEKVVEDIALLYHKYKRKNIFFLDDNLLVDHDRILKLADAIEKSDFCNKIIFNFQARGDNSNYEILKRIYEVGFRGVYFGIETSSEKLMKTVNKGETVKQVADAIRTAKQLGYHVSGNFIFGLPGETHTDRIQAIKLTRTLHLDLVKYNNATPYPGTELFDLAMKQGRINIQGIYENLNSVSTFIENPFRKIPFSYVPPGNTEKQIRFDILHGYFSFYFSWQKLRGVFTRPDLNNAWFDFGHSFPDFLKKLPSIIFLMIILSFKFGGFLIRYPFNKYLNSKSR